MAFIVHDDALGNPDFACSGTVVSTNVVLTAGHCAADESTGAVLDPSAYRVTTGAVDVALNGRGIGVSRVVVDPAYNPETNTSDVALLVLSAPRTAPAIRLAGSADQNLERAGPRALIAGWERHAEAVLPLSSWASSWITALAPPPPAVATTPPPPAPSQPQLPRMALPDSRSYVRQTVAGVLPRAFKHQHA